LFFKNTVKLEELNFDVEGLTNIVEAAVGDWLLTKWSFTQCWKK